jgi:sulfate transport system permease protein
VRVSLTAAALAVIGVLIVVPLVHVFYRALANGVGAYGNALFGNPHTRHAILLTLTVAPAVVALNLVFGVAAAWAIARFRFPGRTVLVSLIDLPFSVSPVVAGLIFVLLFGAQGFFGPWMREHGRATVAGLLALLGTVVVGVGARLRYPGRPLRQAVLTAATGLALAGCAAAYLRWVPGDPGFKVIFATPGLILATAFVTFPFVARELIPVLEATGPDEELAAISLGANGWQMFWRVTLPNIRWGLLYGVILCNARAMGEFGAVYVVSNRIDGTVTMPLQVENLYQGYGAGYGLQPAFALASVLTVLALVTLVARTFLERKVRPAPAATEENGERPG